MITIYKNKNLKTTRFGERSSIEFRGLSTDTKPSGGNIENGTLFLEIDTGSRYLYDLENSRWLLQSQGGGGEYPDADGRSY